MTEQEQEHTIAGRLEVVPDFHSPQLDNQRELLVYLPPSYYASGKHYPVLYMHDGQNLFDRAMAFSDEWQVDETMEMFSRQGVEAIVVGVPNMAEERCNEYSPFIDEKNGGGKGDEYLSFLIDSVKAHIDSHYRTVPDREHTAIVGSSMGGLISLYAFFRRPDVYGMAGVLSPALWFADRAIFSFVQDAPYTEGRLYLDIGTQEGDEALNDARAMRELLLTKGYREGDNFVYFEDEGATHSETAWAGRLPTPLAFLLDR